MSNSVVWDLIRVVTVLVVITAALGVWDRPPKGKRGPRRMPPPVHTGYQPRPLPPGMILKPPQGGSGICRPRSKRCPHCDRRLD